MASSSSSLDSVTMHVSYPGTVDTRFDRAYWVHTHLPLVRKAWVPFGLKSVTAFIPADSLAASGTHTIAIAELVFRDKAALHAALSGSEAPAVHADIKLFTDSVPSRTRGAPL